MREERYPHYPGSRRDAPETSGQAADFIAESAFSIRASVFAVITGAGHSGANGFEIAAALDLHVTQVRSRVSELKESGKIKDSMRRRKGDSGRNGVVWVLPQFAPPERADPQGELMAEWSVSTVASRGG